MLTRKTTYALLLLLCLGFTWGSGYSLARFAMTHDVQPLGYAFWQAVGPAALLSLYSYIYHYHPSTQRLKSVLSYKMYFLCCALLGIVIPNTNMYFIAKHLPSGLLSVLVNTVPLFVYPCALMAREETFDTWRLSALLLGMAGIVLMIAPHGVPILPLWSALTLLSPLSFAMCAIYIRKKQPQAIPPALSAAGMLTAAALLLLPFVAASHAFYSLWLPMTPVKWAILLEIILSSLGYLLFFKLIALAGPVYYSLTGAAVAMTGLFWGKLIYQETADAKQILAILFVLTAIILMSWRQNCLFNTPLIPNKD